MGILGLLSGWEKTMGALNAVMANQLMAHSNLETKVRISDEVINIISSARYGKLSKAEILSELNSDNRVAQMNLIALACDNLHIDPPFNNSHWERVKNPYGLSRLVDETLIQATIQSIQKDSRHEISWPGISASFDFLSLYEKSSPKKYRDLDEMAIETATRFILCLNSYLSEKTQLTYLGHRDMDTITETSLTSFGIETDQALFSKYCLAVHDVATRRTLEDSINNHTLGKQLRLDLDFDNSFPSYCRDLGLSHLLKPEIHTDAINNSDPLYRSYISEEDELAFGKDLIGLIDKVFNHTYSMLLNEKHAKDSVEISQEDIDAFGVDLASCIAFYTTHAVINLRSHDKTLPDAMLKTATEVLSDSFGPDLLDLIKRYCAYKSTGLQ